MPSNKDDLKSKVTGGNPDKKKVLGTIFGADGEPKETDKNEEGVVSMEAAINELEPPKKKAFDKIVVGIHFEPEVKRALDKYQKANGKGAKSALMNDLVKIFLNTEEGQKYKVK